MAAGKKTDIFHVPGGNAPSTHVPNASTTYRNLSKGNLGGVVFGCTKNTLKECLSKQLFGLPHGHFTYVRNIDPGLPLFLFNYSDKKLHGVFEAASSGQLNLDPYGWTGGFKRTQFPAQVQIRVRLQCNPLREDQFKPIISDNYYTVNHFMFELDHAQTSRLLSMFASLAIAPGSSISQQSVGRSISAGVPSRECREGLEKLWAMPADPGNINQYSGKGDAADNFPPSDVDHQSSQSHSYMNGEVNDEIDPLAMKLEGMNILHSETNAKDTPTVDNVPFPRNDHIGTYVSSKDEKEEKHPTYIDNPATIEQLIKELGELKVYVTEQTCKLSHLEEKLARAESEIQGLKSRCSKLELMNCPSTQIPGESTTDQLNEHHLDPRHSIFLLGGHDTLSWLSTIDLYDPSQNIVKSLEPMNSIRSYASVAKLNGELYVFGGGNGQSWFDTVDCYSVVENTWTPKPSLNMARGSLGGAVLHDNVFALGGGNGVDCFSEVEMLDFDIGRWIQTRSMLQKRFALAAVELNGAIYAAGGYDGISYLNSAERFDPREYSWAKVPNMNSRRGCHSLVVLNEKLCALGGFDGNEMVSSVEFFDPRLGSWIMGEPMKCSRGYSAAAVLDGSIYVIGGVKQDQSIADTVECYKEGEGWREIVSTAIGKRCFLSAIAL